MSLREKFENDVDEMEICACPRYEIIDDFKNMVLDAEDEEEIKFLLGEMYDEIVEKVERGELSSDEEDFDEFCETQELLEEDDYSMELEGVFPTGDNITINGDVIVSVYMNSEDIFK